MPIKRSATAVLAAIALALMITACGDNGNEPADTTTVTQATAPSPSDIPVPTTTSTPAQKPTTAPSVKAIDGTYEGNTGKVLTTTITTIKCGGLPVSGFYPEDPHGNNYRPYGDIRLGNNTQAKTVVVTHNVLADHNQFLPNIGCGYRPGGNNDWLYEFRLQAIPAGNNTINCQYVRGTKSCTVNGKKVALR